MSDPFKPVVYFKKNCPHCFKLRLFLLEAGLLDRVVIDEFEPGTADEQRIRDRLAPAFEKPTFPAAEIEPGVFQKDSDFLISHFARIHGIDVDRLETLRVYIEGPLASIGRLFKENRELKAAASQA